MTYKIEKLDDFGRGIVYYNDKITFVKNALIGEEVEIEIIKEFKKYNEAIVKRYVSYSSKRISPECLNSSCGGCVFLNTLYEESIKFKYDKVKNLFFRKLNYNDDIMIVKNEDRFNYRNKITLKVVNGCYGYYEEKSHNLVEINKCLLVEEIINKFLNDIKYLNIKNGEVIIRSNNKEELLIYIKSDDKEMVDIDYLKNKYKIAGIVYNKRVIYNNSYFYDQIGNYSFKISYDAFFQVNRYICNKLFEILNELVMSNEEVLDLYCGVGSLGISVASKVKRVYGIELVENAIRDAKENAKLNNLDNCYYYCGDVSNKILEINKSFDTIIVDPPRSGLSKEVVREVIRINPSKIIYISCDVMTLVRDIEYLSNCYDIKKVYVLDMFSNTYHSESVCILERR